MRKLLLVGIAALTLITSQSQAAGTHEELAETARYDATIGNQVVGVSLDACPDLCFGGALFAAPGYKPSSVVLTDDNFDGVHMVVGQDTDNDGLSGEAGEPRVDGCGGSISLATSTVPFTGDLEVNIFVDLVHSKCAGAFGTSGSIDLFVEVPNE